MGILLTSGANFFLRVLLPLLLLLLPVRPRTIFDDVTWLRTRRARDVTSGLLCDRSPLPFGFGLDFDFDQGTVHGVGSGSSRGVTTCVGGVRVLERPGRLLLSPCPGGLCSSTCFWKASVKSW